MNDIEKVVELFREAILNDSTVKVYHGDSDLIAYPIVYFNKSEMAFIPGISQRLNRSKKATFKGLKVYAETTNICADYDGRVYKTVYIRIDDTHAGEVDVRRTPEFAEFLHKYFGCAYAYDETNTVDCADKVMTKAHEMSGRISNNCIELASALSEVLSSSLMTFKAQGSFLVNPLHISGAVVTHHSVCMKDCSIIDSIQHNKVMCTEDYLDWLYTMNQAVRLDRTLCDIREQVFSKFDFAAETIIMNSLFNREGMTKEKWERIKKDYLKERVDT